MSIGTENPGTSLLGTLRFETWLEEQLKGRRKGTDGPKPAKPVTLHREKNERKSQDYSLAQTVLTKGEREEHRKGRHNHMGANSVQRLHPKLLKRNKKKA